MSNLKQTIINLDKVLGITPIAPPPLPKKPKPSPAKKTILTVPSPKKIDDSEISFLDFVEKVNGRCAVTGLYIGKATFQFTGQDLVHQLFDDPAKAGVLIGSDVAIIILLSAFFYKKINYENLFEFGEIVMYRFAMLQWVYVICAYFF